MKTPFLVAAEVRRRKFWATSEAPIRLLTSAATVFKQVLRDIGRKLDCIPNYNRSIYYLNYMDHPEVLHPQVCNDTDHHYRFLLPGEEVHHPEG